MTVSRTCILWLQLLLFSAGNPAIASSPENDHKAKKLYKEGLALKQSGQLNAASACFTAAIREDEGLTGAHLELALVYRLQQQTESAKQQFLVLLRKEPFHKVALQNVAELYYEQQAFEDALTYAQQAQEAGAGRMERMIGLCYYHLDHADNAIRHLTKALDEEPANPAVPYKLAQVLALQERYEESIGYYHASLRIDSTQANLFYELGMIHYNMAQFKHAAGAFEKANALGRPADADYYYNLGNACLRQSETEEGIRHLKSALTLRPKDIRTMLSLANAYYKKQDYTNALTQWNGILVMQPMNAFAMFMLGKSYIGAGQLAKGQQICDQALALGDVK
ncbi:tetratricopeptide repeat protein [Chitinophaga horti]|uniref:Tetratricopeptide repeat protein n=1 Tax=Chitinophaga horti TaxID=2920382 RepID=A0ABY6IZK7_9BACT|nr:tetratricopeptide repeat protein [Chitinophaga horti]UYQ91337.1 tetratricopeptide repeat protein [Chitinophaga horti]